MSVITTMPCEGAREEAGEGGFVDEAVVLRIAAGPRWARMREFLPPGEDFAGWDLCAVQLPELNGQSVRTNDTTNHGEADGSATDDNHHWWMAGLAGATLAVAVFLTAVSLELESGTLKEQVRLSLPWSP